MNKRLLPIILLTALTSAVPIEADAQGYPAHAVRILVGFSPGGSMDVTARLVAERLKDALGQQVLVENRTGAGGNIAAQALAKSPPDGYMLMLAGGGTMSIRQKFMKLPFNPAKDFAPVIYVANLPLLLVVPASLPARSVRDLLTIARKRPGELTFSSSGVGSTTHLSAEMFQSLSGVSLMHVPYKGSAQMIPELIGGQVGLAFDQITTTKPHLASGKLRALAISTAKRSALMPDMPTVAESGVAKYESASWNGFVVPAGVPKAIVDRLQRDIEASLRHPDMVEKLAAMGAEPVGGTAEQFAAHIRAETQRWGELIDRLGIKPQ
jgi:tripartite-type tricarboxylate transporter receptor subunit TctC